MAVTILEALQNAQLNLNNVARLGAMGVLAILPLAQSQLDNAVSLLEKGYGINDEVESLLERYGSIDEVPEKEASFA